MAGAGAGTGVISKVNSPTIKMDSSLALWPWSLATPHSRIIESGKKMGWRRDGGGGVQISFGARMIDFQVLAMIG